MEDGAHLEIFYPGHAAHGSQGAQRGNDFNLATDGGADIFGQFIAQGHLGQFAFPSCRQGCKTAGPHFHGGRAALHQW